MSYILDALKKAEQQRELGQVPGIDSAHEMRNSAPRKYWLWAIVIILLINVVILLNLFWSREEKPQVISVRDPEPRLPVVRERESVAPHLAVEQAAPRPLPELSPAPDPKPKPENDAKSLKVLKTLPSVSESTVAKERRASALADSPVETVNPVAIPAEEELPLWPQIPGHIFRQISEDLRLDVHVYSDNPGERFVLMNMQKYYEGEKLQNGLVLDEITPDGVVLSLSGERFRVSAQ